MILKTLNLINDLTGHELDHYTHPPSGRETRTLDGAGCGGGGGGVGVGWGWRWDIVYTVSDCFFPYNFNIM